MTEGLRNIKFSKMPSPPITDSEVSKMNADIKESFSKIKPVCDIVMVCPSAESISNFVARVSELKRDVMQELQQYLLFPFITHLKSTEIEKKFEIQWRLVDGMRVVLEKVVVNSYDMCYKIETTLLSMVFDNSKPGMLAEVPEELKHSVMKCLTVLQVNLDKRFREKMLRTQVPLLAQAVFVSVHVAKLEKHRALRLSALNSLMAHTAIHPQLTTDKARIPEPTLEALVVDMLSSILPGVLAALQDVALCPNNPGHAVVVAAVEAIHRILCLTMQDRLLPKKPDGSSDDFFKIFTEQQAQDNTEVSCKEKLKDEKPKRSSKWYAMAGEKLTMITKCLLALRSHEHYRVRRELAVYCARVLNECTVTMQPSMPIVLDILISLSKDEYPAVSTYCAAAVRAHFAAAGPDKHHRTMDNLAENLFVMLNGLPRILNNIDTGRKLYALNLLHGYIQILVDSGRPQRLSGVLSVHHNMARLCHALLAAAALQTHATPRRGMSSSPNTTSWCKLQHLDSPECEKRLQEICGLLGGAECAELILDRLLEMFREQRGCEIAYVMNHMAAGPNSTESFLRRILDTYIEEDVWYLPLEVGSGEAPVTSAETLDVSVYNPRAWVKDSVPGLFEGAVETRYTGISYDAPRPAARREPDKCASLARAQHNTALACLAAAGVGLVARRLRRRFQPYLLRTLPMLLERVGSKHEALHVSGLAALEAVAEAGGHDSVAALVAANADYFTHQVTVRLKKSWNTESALQILSVVMEYSDSSIQDCLYGIVNDVLVQSCDRYYERNLYAYLQVFYAFVDCLYKWFPLEEPQKTTTDDDTSAQIDLFVDLREYIKNTEEAEKLLSNEEFEKETGKSVEEMFKEDQQKKEEDILDYDDKVTEEKPPLPQHITVLIAILKRCAHFSASCPRDDAILALQVLESGLRLLRDRDDQLLPLVHLAWAPLVARFETEEPVVLRRALSLLVAMAELSKDFILSRCVKEVLPRLYQWLRKAAADSHLKDAGSYYRSSAAYLLQIAALASLPSLAVHLRLQDAPLDDAMTAVDAYLSNKQPKTLQTLAVNFFKAILDYSYGAAWWHLRALCANDELLQAPARRLASARGTPYVANDKDIQHNIEAIFDITS
ncbi:TELO2-interacting protein 1 homolog isoform X2 [Ostrinia furnacalis]|uniref:TELO2-interacting protein 1 homolog isoform X2 n=1 Tax=Ostrinia furnacalis TaxID=93504 RepID=UPI0010397F37|nr:TELO2-interacting protein 1 homolog isoform X2 [Ostrinia furnacalis]